MQVSACAATTAAMPQIADGNAATRKSAGWGQLQTKLWKALSRLVLFAQRHNGPTCLIFLRPKLTGTRVNWIHQPATH
jgi:hypothetical protein